MNVLIRTDSPALDLDRQAISAYPRDHEIEAPDQGIIDEEREAPETLATRRAEAPDAGEGRMSTLEQEFTHGRSQS